jgi:hypothetical protein
MTESRPVASPHRIPLQLLSSMGGEICQKLIKLVKRQYLVSCGCVSLEELFDFYKSPQCVGYCPESDCGHSQEVSGHSLAALCGAPALSARYSMT